VTCLCINTHPYTDHINQPETEPPAYLPDATLFANRTVLVINGIDKEDNGRSCSNHSCCGHFNVKGDILFLKRYFQIINGEERDVVKAFLVDRTTGIGTCHVGYVPDRYFAINPQRVFNGVYLYVEHDY
jgi:hypothetical protein